MHDCFYLIKNITKQFGPTRGLSNKLIFYFSFLKKEWYDAAQMI